MKKIIVNNNDINYWIDWLRVKDSRNPFEDGSYYYNCDMSIMTNKKLNSYEREKIAQNIRFVVSGYDNDIKKLRAIEDMYSSGVVDLEKLHNLVVNNEYPTDKE
jgi:hypothetical protein